MSSIKPFSPIRKVQLVWFKRDLRIRDHQPLVHAMTAGTPLCCYVFEPELIQAQDFDWLHFEWTRQSVLELRSSLRRLGGELLIRVGRLPDVFEQLSQQVEIDSLWSHMETGNEISFQRDRRVARWVRSRGIRWTEIPQFGVVRGLKNRDGWARQWQTAMERPVLDPPGQLTVVEGLEAGAVPEASEFGLVRGCRKDFQRPGESAAHECLDSFLDSRAVNYRYEMSSPVTAPTSCSRLSPYLANGNISLRSVYQRTRQRTIELRQLRQAGKPIEGSWLQSLSSFEGRLRWHCHFIQKLEDEPEIEFRNTNRVYDGLREDDFDRRKFEAWCRGETGYPMVDACMRALLETGWINFRMRAMLVSFAAYHLWLHWREPALFLARQFIDYEPGIHYSQIQMQSGVTGINTVRIYSPIKQVQDQDPQGIFLRRYLPELEGVPDHLLAEPHRMSEMEQILYGCRIGNDYPAPIVDHAQQYRWARARMHAVKNSQPAREESQRIYRKHGSRSKRKR